MSERKASRFQPEIDRSQLVSMAEATLGSMSPGDLSIFTAALQSKSEKLTQLVRDREDFTETDFHDFFTRFLTSRRHSRTIIGSNAASATAAAIKSLRVSSLDPSVSIQRFKSLKGAQPGILEDVAFESIHFLNPEKFGLCTRWVFNPESGKGALSAAVGGELPPDFASRQELLSEARGIVEEAGFRSAGFFGLDIMLSLTYAGGIMGAKDNSMNSGGMEALFPNSTVLAAMILGVRREIIAHT